ncbi:unnamed protein product [Rangifer tarandus platyrhynchus]|uniref:Uncharacterized protein n=2 Tax=Rangifer tarandus platyrhynchus TaxID=3082113 RepID=A0ACB0DPV5_RANTA|nr:unnamed protein product [Rangifer tarandus platyrhynchus]CAI9690289.1 unnamed protein product [Rangifer tarandus platyrhynchus]
MASLVLDPVLCEPPRLAVHSEETAELAPALCSSVEETLYAQATQFSLKRRPEEADGYPHAPWRGTVECRSEEAPREGTHKPMRDHRSCGRGSSGTCDLGPLGGLLSLEGHLLSPGCGRNWSQDSASGGTGRAPRGTRRARGLATAPLAPHSSDHSAKHSRGSKLRGGGSQLGDGEHIGERLGGTLRLSDSTRLLLPVRPPRSSTWPRCARDAPSLSP